MSAILLAGHGSHISPNTAGLVWSCVDQLRSMGVADEVGACFWKESPPFSQALNAFQAESVIVVPVLAADGYFARTVIPQEMGLSGELTRRGERRIYYTKPPGIHPGAGAVLSAQVDEALEALQLDAQDVAVAIIGHGTRREARSRDAAILQARSLAARRPDLQVLEAWLDDEPSIPSVYERTDAANILAVAWFLAPGSHVSSDVPRELGLSPGVVSGRVCGRSVYYLGAPALADALCEVIVELARACEADIAAQRPVSVWSGFPRAGASALQGEMCERGELVFGELLLTPAEVRPLAGKPGGHSIHAPGTLRRVVRERPFRPLPEARGLPGGWTVPVNRPEDLPAIVETVYPGAVADRAARHTGRFVAESLATVAARQTGNFRGVDELPVDRVASTMAELCANCIRQPVWHGVEVTGDELPCATPCNLWLSRALKESA